MAGGLESLQAALADRYTIERELGAGGMATVYLALDLRHERQVALKVLRPELTASLGPDRFLREIRTTAQLTHPHILPLLDSGDAAATLFYVMPYVEGESLRDRLSREKQLPLDDALQLTREVADALSYAHSHGVVHRDVKPENILLQSGHAVVADFGIAKAIATAGSERLTETGLSIGTPAYMSPEQAAGSADVDGRSDLYSLGCVLYEMLAGEPPFTGPSAQAVVAKRLSTPAPRVSILRDTVPAGIEAALNKALARTPADRWVTAADFAAALVHPEALGKADALGRRRTGAPWSPLAKWLAAAGVLVAAIVGVLLATGVLRPSGSAGGGARLSSLAVLPLRNLSGDSTQEYFADAMTEAIITELGRVAALTVISRTSVMGYKGKQVPLRTIARELGVQGIVEGSVVREGGQVRVTARLIDGRTDRSLWDSTYDRQMAGILTLYTEVARTIAGAIGATLSPAEAQRLQASRTVNPEAYDEFLLGMQDFEVGTAEALGRAIAHFRRAVALDSTFVDPHVALVNAYRSLTAIGAMPPRVSSPLARREAERAVALDSGSVLAHMALARFMGYFEWRWAEAGRHYRRALELGPGVSALHAAYTRYLLTVGRTDEAAEHALRVVALEPRQARGWEAVGEVYMFSGRLQEAVAAYEKALELDSSAWLARGNLGFTYALLGRHQDGIESVLRARGGDCNQCVLQGYAIIYAFAGRPADAQRWLDSALAVGRAVGWVDPYNFGVVYALLGDADRALAYFDRAIDERSMNVSLLKIDFLPARFKADPRYHALLRRINLE